MITRPLTGLAYAIPVGIVILNDDVRGRRWRDFALAMAPGTIVLAIIPLWSVETTGDWRVTPLQRYTRDYMPDDLPGFGLIATPPAHNPHETFVQNVANPEAERLLVAYDRGSAENARLLALMPDRTPYLFDEANSRAMRYPGRP